MEYNLVGINGNAFAIMGYVVKALKKENKSQEDINNYLEKARSIDYDNLVKVSQEVIEELNCGLNNK